MCWPTRCFSLFPGLQEFKEEQFRGRFLQVSVARENFLEKLKREREEAALNNPAGAVAPESANITENVVRAAPVKLPTLKVKKETAVSSSSSSEESSSDEEVAPAKPAKPAVTLPVKPTNGVKKKAASSSSSSSSSSSEPESSEDEGNLIMRKKSKMYMENGKVTVTFNWLISSKIITNFSWFFSI